MNVLCACMSMPVAMILKGYIYFLRITYVPLSGFFVRVSVWLFDCY